MTPVRVTPTRPGADLAALRAHVAARCRGDARVRPHDCTGLRFLVRDAFRDAFDALARRHGFAVEPDTREAFG